jgi:hypothetical protein
MFTIAVLSALVAGYCAGRAHGHWLTAEKIRNLAKRLRNFRATM